jgi:hypothetical protein
MRIGMFCRIEAAGAVDQQHGVLAHADIVAWRWRLEEGMG